MSMINAGDFPIDPNVVDGTELAARLNRLKLAIYSGLSNATRPPDITAGGTWVKFTAPSTYTLMVFNGTVDAAVAVGDVTSGTIALPFNTATNYKTGDLIFDTATGTLQSAKHDIASGSAYNAGDWNANQNIATTFVKKVGDTMTGPLVLSGNASTALQAVPKQQLDASISAGVAGVGGAFRNKVIGGDFSLNPWQWATSFAVVTGAANFAADRFPFYNQNDGGVTLSKVLDSPTPLQSGVYTAHCLRMNVTTADTSIGAGQFAMLQHRIEGYNALAFGFGQPGTRYVTLSFWVKSNKTGIYSASLRNNVVDRSFILEYTINAANTWEKKVLVFPVATTGVWNAADLPGLVITWALAAGTTYQGAPNTWLNVDNVATANQVNWMDSTANDFRIALVQIEAGQLSDTVFETRNAHETLIQCMRYCQYCGAGWSGMEENATSFSMSFPLQVPMRATPQLTVLPNIVANGLSTRIPAGATDRTITGLNLNTYAGTNQAMWVHWLCAGGNVAGRFIQGRDAAAIFKAGAEI